MEEENVINLLEEVVGMLEDHNLGLKNIRCISNKEGFIPIADFVSAAEKIWYDYGYGEVNIDPTLKIIGAHWWFERANYDGYEGWVFHKKPDWPKIQAVGFKLDAKRPLSDSDPTYRFERRKKGKI